MPTSVTLFRITTDCRDVLPRQLQGKGYPRGWGQVTGEAEKLDTPALETDFGSILGFPGIWDQGEANGGGQGETHGRGQEGAKYRGVRGGSTTPKFPQGVLGLLSQ
jgi:hypothetical protein